MYKKIEQFIKKHKWWILITFVFLAVRIIVWTTFWQASQNFGGFQHFIAHAQPAESVLMNLFHDYCDWHPPLYYVFTSLIQNIFRNVWPIFVFQIILAYVSLIFSYKIARLYLSEKIALISIFLIAINPVWAWYNILLKSLNLLTVFLLIGIFYFFKFFKESRIKHFYLASFFFGLSALTRPNFFLFTVVLSVFLLFSQFIIKRLKEDNILYASKKNLFIILLTFNVIFFAVLSPWLIRNKIVYDRYVLANIMSTNLYYYNVPMSIAYDEKIAYAEARNRLAKLAKDNLGENVGDQGDCSHLSAEEFSKQLKYFKGYSREYILTNPSTYFTMHLVKATPFFFQSGAFNMLSWYTNDYVKLDVTGAFLRGDFAAIADFIKSMDFKIFFWLLGLIFWGTCSLSLAIAIFYTWKKSKEKFIFFSFSFLIILYNALVVSPFVEIRCKLPMSILFFVPLVYMISVIIKKRK